MYAMFLAGPVFGQKAPLIIGIEHYSIENGLANRDISNCQIDQKGFVWVATRNGLSRFDGTGFKNYNPQSTKFKNGWLSDLMIDVNGMVWFFPAVDHSDVSVMDPRSDAVRPFDDFFAGNCPFQSSEICRFRQGTNNDFEVFIILKSERVFKYDGQFREIKKPAGFNMGEWSHLSEGPSGTHLWLYNGEYLETGANGEKVISGRTEVASNSVFPAKGGGHFLLGSNFPFDSIKGRDFLWLKMPGQLASPVRFTIDGRPFKIFGLGYAKMNDDGSGWLFTENHLYRVDENGAIHEKIDLPAARTGGRLPSIQCIAPQDSAEIVWVGTGEGLYKVHLSANKFSNHLPGSSIRGMGRFGDSLLINTYDGQKIFRFSTQKTEGSDAAVKAGLGFASAPDGRLFTGMESFFIWQNRPGSPVRKKAWVKSRPVGAAMSLPFFDPKTGKIWVGSTNGLYFYDENTDSLQLFTKDARLASGSIRHFLRNSDGLWVATSKGLFLLDNMKGTVYFLDEKSGLPVSEVRFVHEDRNGIFWLATYGGGLVRCKRGAGAQKLTDFEAFDERRGFSNNNIYSIHEDRFGFLWLPSDYGLMRFDKKTGKVNVFLPGDGLPHEEFNFLAQFEAADGRIFLGGLNGFTVFQPADFLDKKPRNKPLHLISLAVLDGKSEKLEERSFEAHTRGAIELDSDDRFFEAKFALLDYISPAQNRYAYFIEGLEKDWNLLNDNTLRISGLPPGRYKLRVRAQGSDGQWSASEINLPLIVRAPFYQKWQFWMLMSGLSALLFFMNSRWRTQKLLRDRENLEKEVAVRTATISQQADALLALDRAKNRFFENITHEFRTPLTLILGPIRDLLRGAETQAHRPKLEIAKNNAERLSVMVNQLLELAKLASGELGLHFRRGDILSVLRDVFEQFRPLAERKDIDLNWHSSFHELPGIADRNVLERVAFNLLSNALKFTPQGGQVDFFVQKNAFNTENQSKTGAEDHFRIIVSDTGIGIPEADLPRIFDRFFQSDDSATRRFEGTGIGLALVKELVERVGGTISVKSRTGEGSRFSVQLPLVLPAGATVENGDLKSGGFVAENPSFKNMVGKNLADNLAKKPLNAPDETSVEHATEQPDGMPTILLVEDNSEMRAYLKLMLTGVGYIVFEAENGAIGIELARETVPDLIISDVMMPEKDGFELTATLKNDLLTSHIPIVLLTAKWRAEDKITGYRTGADAYLPKPFDTEELLVRLAQLLDVRKRLQKKYLAPLPSSEKMGAPDDGALDGASTEIVLSALDFEFLERLYERISDEMADENLTAELLATKFFMSRSQFFAKVKALTGLPPASLLRNIRLDAAHKFILENPNAPVSEVVQRVGLNDARNFSMIFKKRFGKSPQEMRK